MQNTKKNNIVTNKYSFEEYLSLINGAPVSEDSLLRKACEYVWKLDPDEILPSSLDVALSLSKLGSDETTLIVSLLSTTVLINSVDKSELDSVF